MSLLWPGGHMRIGMVGSQWIMAPEGSEPSDPAGVEPSPRVPLTLDDLYKPPTATPTIRNLPRIAGNALRIVWDCAKGKLLLSFSLQLINGAFIALVLVGGQKFLQDVLAAERLGSGIGSLVPSLLLVGGLTLGVGITTAFSNQAEEMLTAQLERYSQERIMDVALSVEYEAYETPSFHDSLQRASIGGQTRTWQLVQGLSNLARATVGLLGVTVALSALSPLLVPFVIFGAIPLLIAATRSGQAMFSFMSATTPLGRRLGYLYGLLTDKESAQEVRAFGLAGFLRSRHSDLYDQYLAEHHRNVRKRTRISAIGSLGMSMVLAASLFTLLLLVLRQSLSLASAGAAAGAIALLSSRLVLFSWGANVLNESAPFVEDFKAFLALRPDPSSQQASPGLSSAFSSLELVEVGFTYPSAQTPAVAAVTMQIGKGEIVALVGENGSGKTTLAKLLCGLYSPQAGQFLWDKTDTATVDKSELRRMVAVIFQDFVQYLMTAEENIGMGRHERFYDHEAIVRAAEHAGAHELISRLPDGYLTRLGPEFEGGTDLSVGQWQRIALARAFFRDAPFIILDEPTASLDARAEHQLFESIRSLAKGRSVLLISHRFSSVRSADRIYVLKAGHIVEQGTHDQLMGCDGLYKELFTLQASAYV